MLEVGKSFPTITGRMVDDKVFSPSLCFGKKIFYSFFRFTACPFCDLYFNSILSKRKELDANNIQFVAIFEMELSDLKEFFAAHKDRYYGYVIGDPKGDLYSKCGLTRSNMAVAQSVFIKQQLSTMEKEHGTRTSLDSDKLSAGQKSDASGKKNRLPGQFLVDEKGKILKLHYSSNLHDRLPLTEVLKA